MDPHYYLIILQNIKTMKLFILSLLLTLTNLTYSQNLEKQLFATDKVMHMGVGYFVGSTGTFIADQMNAKNPEFWGLGSVVIVGVGKEVYDYVSGRGTPERVDAFVTIVSGMIGSATIKMTIDKRNEKNKKKVVDF
jgi:hypothetical protein